MSQAIEDALKHMHIIELAKECGYQRDCEDDAFDYFDLEAFYQQAFRDGQFEMKGRAIDIAFIAELAGEAYELIRELEVE